MPPDRGEGLGVSSLLEPWIAFDSPCLENPLLRPKWALRAQKEVEVGVSLRTGVVAEGDHPALGGLFSHVGGG